ncbi:hypothetical protein ISN45_Aa04g007490 [Arabidopsis thaliana x Arabidopsis arenosa]|uniref:Transmembrane protein n=1 Tax=Arabidopsis thaliana x Arabidopsis arenosa TaxID=1240361 RepID=A0A8T2A432_9BRAS|nr:hypothetical protein ISN45_Aa04g007490 [Arabidopsis thaliana x Arabidopsis arenosa]
MAEEPATPSLIPNSNPTRYDTASKSQTREEDSANRIKAKVESIDHVTKLLNASKVANFNFQALLDSWNKRNRARIERNVDGITSPYYVAPCFLAFLFIPWIYFEFLVFRDTSSFHFDYAIFGANSF